MAAKKRRVWAASGRWRVRRPGAGQCGSGSQRRPSDGRRWRRCRRPARAGACRCSWGTSTGARSLVAVADVGAEAVGLTPLPQLLGQAGLAHPGLAADHHEGTRTGSGPVHEPLELGPLLFPSDERCHVGDRLIRPDGFDPTVRGRHDCAGRRKTGRDGQVGVVAEDGRLQFAQRRARLQPELAGQQGAEALVGLQGVGLSARPVQRHDQLGPEPLAEGLQADPTSSSPTSSLCRPRASSASARRSVTTQRRSSAGLPRRRRTARRSSGPSNRNSSSPIDLPQSGRSSTQLVKTTQCRGTALM